MAGVTSEQDEATREGKMGLSCPLGISRFIPSKAKFLGVIFWPYKKFFIDLACSVNNVYIMHKYLSTGFILSVYFSQLI